MSLLAAYQENLQTASAGRGWQYSRPTRRWWLATPSPLRLAIAETG